ncbi:hypothetical protein ACX8XP_15165 [Calditrichota bacterium LG25]
MLRRNIHILKIIIIIFLIFNDTKTQTVIIRLGQIEQNPNTHEWALYVYADVFDQNNILVPNSQAKSYYYEWYKNFCNNSDYFLSSFGTGLNQIRPDGHWEKQPGDPDCCPDCSFMTYYIKVRVRINNTWYWSEEVRLPDNETGSLSPREEIVVRQRREDQSLAGVFGRKIINKIYYYQESMTFYNLAGEMEVFKATQDVLENPYEKYCYWKEGDTKINDVVNHKSFLIQDQQQPLIAQLCKIYNASLRSYLISSHSFIVNGYLQLRDPWYIDDYTDPLGPRNRGTNAIDHTVIDSANNLGIYSPFKGVFLEQGYENGVWNPPYYSVKAEARQTFTAHGQQITGYFLGWEGTDVTFQYADQQETPLVFHAANAEARTVYKGHLASSAAGATGYNNGRIAL